MAKLSLLALQCINLNLNGYQRKSTSSPRSPTLVVSKYSPDEYERIAYCNGIAGGDDHPELVYRSDFYTTPFPKPSGRFPSIPVKSLRGVFNTPLNSVWDTVSPHIRDLIKARKIQWSSIDPARFYTYGPAEERQNGSLGPVVI
ncbi:hypothetical protein H0H81_004717 [Sphagnurus paluster]|uniref:Uncharacterized protein n=1 Tax=Sphagnurus paluster TaxID=117069 RepID=A0A9P7KH43_9AGAR|nr:hypothetical protein H0H81_004717 [Sphagnurus paluster]